MDIEIKEDYKLKLFKLIEDNDITFRELINVIFREFFEEKSKLKTDNMEIQTLINAISTLSNVIDSLNRAGEKKKIEEVSDKLLTLIKQLK